METLAAKHDRFDVVGFGGGDTPEAGREFVSKHGLTFPNLFDESRDAWNELGIPAQPAWALYNETGMLLGRGAGAVSAATVLGLLPQ